jgi:hypothetical protein
MLQKQNPENKSNFLSTEFFTWIQSANTQVPKKSAWKFGFYQFQENKIPVKENNIQLRQFHVKYFKVKTFYYCAWK